MHLRAVGLVLVVIVVGVLCRLFDMSIEAAYRMIALGWGFMFLMDVGDIAASLESIAEAQDAEYECEECAEEDDEEEWE